MNKKKVLLLTFLIIIMLLSTVNFVQAQENQFQDITNILKDVVMMFSAVFSLDYLDTPEKAFGFLMFMMWVLIFTIMYIGATTAFKGRANNRQVMVICLVIATMSVVLFYFQKGLLEKLFGSWLIWLYFILYFGTIGSIVFVVWKFVPNNPLGCLFKAGILFVGLLMTSLAKGDVENTLDNLENAMNYYSFIGPLFYFFIIKLKEKRNDIFS